MKLNKQMKEKIEIVANEQGLKINSSNFAYIACDCIANELVDILIQYDVSVQDVQMIGYMFQKKLCKLGIKKEDTLKEVNHTCIHYDMDGLNINEFCFTNSLKQVELLKEKGYSVLLNPSSDDGKKLNANFFVLGKEKHQE